MKKLALLSLLVLLTVSFLACQKLTVPLGDIKESKDKVEYTQPVRKIEPESTK